MYRIIKDIRLSGAQEHMAEHEDGNHEAWSIPTLCGVGTAILMDASFIRIPRLCLDIFAGNFCNYSKEHHAWEPDYSLYVFYMVGDHRSPVYDEGGSSLEVCIHNYYPHLSVDEIENMLCEIHLSEEGELLN